MASVKPDAAIGARKSVVITFPRDLVRITARSA
jgi:hypothetical protein